MIDTNEIQSKTNWQRISLKSKANGAPYEEQETIVNCLWPEDTYLQRRLNSSRPSRIPDVFEDHRQAPQEDIRTEFEECMFASDSVRDTPKIGICVEVPSDDWTWCGNPILHQSLPRGFKHLRQIIEHFGRKAPPRRMKVPCKLAILRLTSLAQLRLTSRGRSQTVN